MSAKKEINAAADWSVAAIISFGVFVPYCTAQPLSDAFGAPSNPTHFCVHRCGIPCCFFLRFGIEEVTRKSFVYFMHCYGSLNFVRRFVFTYTQHTTLSSAAYAG